MIYNNKLTSYPANRKNSAFKLVNFFEFCYNYSRFVYSSWH